MRTPVVKVPTTPNNVRQEDALLNKEEWTRNDLDQLSKILEHYERTW